MTTLFKTANASGTTANGMATNASSLNKNVDLFFLAGASRGKDLTPQFAAALAEDTEVAVRILQWARDARGGAGERETFRKLFGYLIKHDQVTAAKILHKVPELGRWDDLFITFGTSLERQSLKMIADSLNVSHNGLCAKWMPRQGPIAGKLRSYMKLTPKAYRHLLVALSDTVEQKMCAQDWSKITYSHVPSVASSRYQKAFTKRDPLRYAEFKEKLVSGEETVHASALFPYDVIRSMRSGSETVSNAQWDALPDFMEGSEESILPVVDVSGSMSGVSVSGSITAMDVAVSLGLYISERSKGIFKDQFVTFSDTPKMQKLNGTLKQRMNQLQSADWGMSTNLQAVFDLILAAAKRHNLTQDQLPAKVLILSDMEFNQCVRDSSGTTANNTAYDMIRKKFSHAGYTMPALVFWNLNGRAGNSPVTYNTSGTALVSGFSPTIVKSVLGNKDMSPINVMLGTVMVEKYDY